MRKQGILLKHCVHRAQIWLQLGDVLAKEANFTRCNILKPRDHPQQSGFATARRTKQGEKFVIRNRQRHAVQRRYRAKAFDDLINIDGAVHPCSYPPFPW